MQTYLHLKNTHDYALPEAFRNDDVRFAGELVRFFLNEFTSEGDSVLDPFAGYGTTLFTAQAMKRIPYGIEYSAERCEFIRQHVTSGRIIQGDSRRLAEFELPPLDFSIASPPYMRPQDKENPFTAYQEMDGDYETYLEDIKTVYAELGKKLRPGARAVIEVANLKHEYGVTPLAWHIAERVSQVLHFEGEVIACWDHYGYGYDHSYCLVFSKA